jgi:hypothetical protein
MRGNNNMPLGLGGSHDCSRPSGRMTGIRSWMWATASFAFVVRTAKLIGFFSAVSNSVSRARRCLPSRRARPFSA